MSYERSYRIRHYECDAYGHLNNTAYLRYLEELELSAGFADSAAATWPWDTANVTYSQPLRFGDAVDVSARTAEEGADGVLRAYEFRRAGDGAAAASARVRWRRDGAPAPPLPAADSAEGPVHPFTQRRTVEWRDVDQSSRVSPATMAEYAEDCGLAVAANFGWPLDRCTKAGFAMVLRSHDVTYGALPGLGDELTVTTWASTARRVAAVRHYLFTDSSGATSARFDSRYVWVDIQSMRPIRIPPDFLADFEANFVAS